MPEPLQLAPLDVEEQQLYSELLAMAELLTVSLRECHPAEEAHFRRLHPGSRSFGHDPKFMHKDERRPTGKSRASLYGSAFSSPQQPVTAAATRIRPVSLPLHSPLTSDQDPEILELLHLRQELPSNLRRGSHSFLVENHGPGLGGADPHQTPSDA
ncbi:hypothetical protein AMECASPLE_036549 [Ameca splendens]|uniref:Uncharacterized protein n=1 Tax=Ameca splendens TaxID=208324 RepID=A0ABV0XKQ7_9TELE